MLAERELKKQQCPLTLTRTVTVASPGGIAPPISKASTKNVNVASVPENDSKSKVFKSVSSPVNLFSEKYWSASRVRIP